MKQGIIIVAGGSGTRMGSAVPKQFMPLCGIPVLVHTLRRFLAECPGGRVVVALPEDQICRWEGIAREFSLLGTHIVCPGGHTRFQSVKNALDFVRDTRLVAIHDGVRPLVAPETIRQGFAIAAETGTAVPVVVPVDSFRMVTEHGSEIVSRQKLRAVQTPQVFSTDLITRAYDTPYQEAFTDDASVVETLGVPVSLFEGTSGNIKITGPEDIIVAEALCEKIYGETV